MCLCVHIGATPQPTSLSGLVLMMSLSRKYSSHSQVSTLHVAGTAVRRFILGAVTCVRHDEAAPTPRGGKVAMKPVILIRLNLMFIFRGKQYLGVGMNLSLILVIK